MNIIDILGTFSLVFGLVYLVLQIFQKHYMWYFCLVSSAAATVVALHSHVWANAGFNAYSAVMAVVGIISWRKFRTADSGKAGSRWKISAMHIVRLGGRELALSLAAIAAVAAALFFLLRYLDDPLPLADSTGMAFGVVATLWLTRSHKEHWYLWIVSDIISISIYIHQSVPQLAALYSAYLVSAIVGIIIWNRYGVTVGEGE